MKRKKPYLLAGLVLLLFLLCTACGNTEGQIAPQDDPNEGLGGGLSEDTVNDFSGFEGIWLGEADNDYDSMEFDAEGNWTLYLSGEVVDDGYLRYEPEWEAIYAYSGLGDGYNTDDCYWEITKNGDYTHDGIRELHFDAICYIPEDSIPYFSEKYITNTDSELYDFYTGMWLTTATAYGNSQRGDNYYLHTVSWQGNSYLIEFAYSTNWQYNVGDWAQVLTKSYAVYLPEDYDGLVFAAEAQPDTYKDSAKRMQLDSISPEASLMDIDTVDPYRSLYFSLCY